MKLGLLITGCVLAAVTSSSYADSMRCGTRLITDGDSMTSVLLRCGEPMLRNYSGLKVKRGVGRNYKTEVTIETWTYNKGSQKFLRILRFEGDILTSIRDGERAP